MLGTESLDALHLGGTGISPPDNFSYRSNFRFRSRFRSSSCSTTSGDIFYCSGSRQLNHSSVYFVTIATAAAHHRQTTISPTFPGFVGGWSSWVTCTVSGDSVSFSSEQLSGGAHCGQEVLDHRRRFRAIMSSTSRQSTSQLVVNQRARQHHSRGAPRPHGPSRPHPIFHNCHHNKQYIHCQL